VLLVVVVVLVVHHRTNHPHLNHHQAMVLVLVPVLVLVVHRRLNHHQQQLVALMLQQSIKLLATQLKPMLLGLNMVLKYELLVSMLMPTHKSFVDQLLVVYKPIHKISKFASFNHHLFHHQA
jgi:hypothetical protein